MSDSPRERAVALRREGKLLRDIAAELGVSLGAVHKWTVNMGVNTAVNIVNTGVNSREHVHEAPSDGPCSRGKHPLNRGREQAVNVNIVNKKREHREHVHGDPVERVLGQLEGVKKVGANQWEARCPTHEDRKASLSVSRGDDGRALLHCHAMCGNLEVVRALGLSLKDLFSPDTTRDSSFFASRPTIVATYDYTDEHGNLLFQVVRCEGKKFFQRQPNRSGGWTDNLKGVPRVLYRLPELIAADPADWVFVVEGEKDVDSLSAIGLVATCNPGGSGSWSNLRDDLPLEGRRIVVVPDRDPPGELHANDVIRRLVGRAAEVRTIAAPEGHKDVSKWIETRDALSPDELRGALLAAVDAAPAIDASNLPTLPEAASSDGPAKLGDRDPNTGRLVLSSRRTLPTAKAFTQEFFSHPEGRTLHSYAGLLLEWSHNRYITIEDEAIKNRLQPWLHDALRYVTNPATRELELVDFDSNPTTVKAAIDSVRTYVHLSASTSPPAWLADGAGLYEARDILPCRTCNLHLPTRSLIPPTPRLFNMNALDFDFDPQAPTPDRWLQFLTAIWGEDREQISLLQEWFGYCLTADTSQQKMLLMIGPKRSGKGTIGRVLTRLMGVGNVAGPTTSSLAGGFGLQPLIGKSLAIVSDARFSGDNIAIVVERLLCISGEDALTIDRKFLSSVTMKLPTRFMFLTNELPRLTDASGALTGRFLFLQLKRSFYGREDTELTDRLLVELPGILNWAIEGWWRLRQRGRFLQPASAADAIRDTEDLASPVLAFVRDRCMVEENTRIWADDLYDAWRVWCESDGRFNVTTKQVFGRDLRAAVPGLVTRRGSGNARFYEGLQLKVAA